MRDKQNPAVVDGGTPARDGHSPCEKGEETPRSYYYDDATGYEIYEDEDDAEADDQAETAEES